MKEQLAERRAEIERGETEKRSEVKGEKGRDTRRCRCSEGSTHSPCTTLE